MARQTKELESSFDVDFVAISEDEVVAWHAKLLLLLQLLKKERFVWLIPAHWIGAHDQLLV